MSDPLSQAGAAGRGICPRTHRLAVCVNIHCAMNGAEDIVEHLVVEHGAAPGVESASGLSVELTYCFAACDMGPNIDLDGVFYEGMTPDKLDELLARVREEDDREKG